MTFCGACGAGVEAGSAFCRACGRKLAGSKSRRWPWLLGGAVIWAGCAWFGVLLVVAVLEGNMVEAQMADAVAHSPIVVEEMQYPPLDAPSDESFPLTRFDSGPDRNPELEDTAPGEGAVLRASR